MDPLDFFIMEEFIFPEEGGVTGTVEVTCPHCDSVWDLEVDSGNSDDGFRCGECNGEFSVDWVEQRVTWER